MTSINLDNFEEARSAQVKAIVRELYGESNAKDAAVLSDAAIKVRDGTQKQYVLDNLDILLKNADARHRKAWDDIGRVRKKPFKSAAEIRAEAEAITASRTYTDVDQLAWESIGQRKKS